MTCNENSVIIFYDFNINSIYKSYIDNDKGSQYLINDFTVFEKNEIKKIIGSCEKGYIKIWNYDSTKLIKRINLKNLVIFMVFVY